MEFNTLLFQVDQSLTKEEGQAMAFLIRDLISQDPHYLDSAKKIFSLLEDRGILSPERPNILGELLSIIGRLDLIRDYELNFNNKQSQISPYRKMLFNVSENITDRELVDLKFLLQNKLSRNKLQDNKTILQVLLQMEKEDHLSSSNLETLKELIGHVVPNLKKKITQFEAETAGRITQETQVEFPKAQSASVSSEHSQRRCSLEAPSIPGDSNTTIEEQTQALSLHSSSCSQDQSHHISYTSLLENNNLSPADPPKYDQNEMARYKMKGEKRGYCLIINNYDFSQSNGNWKNRPGTDIDLKCLMEVFEWLGFLLLVENDCSQQQILSLVQQLSSQDHSQMDCLVCCVLSHGAKGSVIGVDGHAVPLWKITEHFNGTRCGSLMGKPKLFFIQACQGTLQQQAAHICTDSDTPSSTQSDAQPCAETIPSDADFLLSMATVPSYVCFRDKSQGSWFIQSLCRNLKELVPREIDLLSILTKVNDDVSHMTDPRTMSKKQVPQPAFSLRKKVVFPIPSGPLGQAP